MTSARKGIKRFDKLLRGAAAAVFWLAVWGAAALITGKEILLPSPYAVFTRFIELAVTPDFWASLSVSLLRVAGGYLTGVAAGVITAVLTVRYAAARVLVSPMLTAVRATPVASFIILALVWIGRGAVPLFTSFLMVYPVVWSVVDTAVTNADSQLYEVTRLFRFSRMKTLKLFYIPSVLPSFTAVCKTSLGLAWKAGIAAEVLCTPKLSLGARVYESKLYLETVDLFAWTATVVLLSVFLEQATVRLIGLLSGGASGANKANNKVKIPEQAV